MGKLDPPTRPEVIVGLDAPDDCAVVEYGGSQSDSNDRKQPSSSERHGNGSALCVHSVDFFRSFIADPYVFGQVAAVHSMSDCHAM